MTLAECRSLPKGTVVSWSMGDGWYQEVEYLGLTEVTSFGKSTFSDLMNNNIDFSKGRKSLEAHISYIDERGRKIDRYVNPRALRKV